MSLNREKIWLGGFVGGVVWIIWSVIINMVVIGRARYEAMQAAGLFLKEGRYPAVEDGFFVGSLGMGHSFLRQWQAV